MKRQKSLQTVLKRKETTHGGVKQKLLRLFEERPIFPSPILYEDSLEKLYQSRLLKEKGDADSQASSVGEYKVSKPGLTETK